MNLQAQQQLIDRPYIERVNVNYETGEITIDWEILSPRVFPYDAEYFEIFWYKEESTGSPNNILIATIDDPSVRTYTFSYDDKVLLFPDMPDPRLTTVSFSVGAGNVTDNVKSLRAYEHYNTQINSVFDSCRFEIILNWHPYKGWQSNHPPYKGFKSYTLMFSREGGAYEKLIETEDTTYNHIVEANIRYSYYIIANRSDNLPATSYFTSKESKMRAAPSYINALSTQYNDDGFAEVSFSIDPAGQTRLFQFSGTSKADFGFVSLASLYILSNDTTLTDTQRRGDTYYYRLEAWHTCMNDFTARSNTVTALWLQVEQNDMSNFLQWKPFTKWKDNGGNDRNARYEIWRKIGDNPEEFIDVVSDPEKDFSDFFSVNDCIEDEMCYWLKAIPNANLPSEYAISNIACIKPEPRIYIPQAFTPEGHVENSHWMPDFTPCIFDNYLRDYLLIIYDRTGAKVFETKNYNDVGWNGKLMNGNHANEGVYVFYLRYVTAVGKTIERRGTLSLIRP